VASDDKYVGDPESLRAWQARMGFTFVTAAEALGISLSSYCAMLAINVSKPKYKSRIDLRTALACAAIERGLKPWNERN
jgi:hypothetical protein